MHTSTPWFQYWWACQLAIPISINPDEWIAAEVLRGWICPYPITSPSCGCDNQFQKPKRCQCIKLCSNFLGFIMASISADGQSIQACISLLFNTLTHFPADHTSTKDIHSLTATFGGRLTRPFSQHILKLLLHFKLKVLQISPADLSPPSLAEGRRGYCLLHKWIQHHQVVGWPFLMTLCSVLGLCPNLIFPWLALLNWSNM